MKIAPLDRGIEEVQWQNEEELGLLDIPSIVPGDIPSESPLDEILAPLGFTHRLLRSLAPRLTHRHILQPAVFQGLTRQIPDRLRSVAETAETAHVRRALLTAADVLEEQKQNTEILNAYRRLLLKG